MRRLLSAVLTAPLALPLAAAPDAIPVDDSLPASWLNGHFTGWDGEGIAHHRLAQALGHEVVQDTRDDRTPGRTRASAPHSSGMGYFVSDPHKVVQPLFRGELSEDELADAVKKYPYSFAWYPQLSRAIDDREVNRMRSNDPELFELYRRSYEATKAWANTDAAFPGNLGVLQRWGENRWEPVGDFQQQSVIDEQVEQIVAYLKETDDNDFDYRFAGILIDVVEQWEGFKWNTNRPLPGEQPEIYAVEHDGIEHDFGTFREGWYHFLAALRDGLDEAFPDRETYFLWEPTPLHEPWVQPLVDMTYDSVTPEMIAKIRGDALVDEKPDLSYLVDDRLQNPGGDLEGWPLTRLGSATADLFAKNPHHPTLLNYLGEISSRGGWFFSYGSFDRSRREAHTFEPHITLVRALSAWQNHHGTPVNTRVWDAADETYLAPSAFGDLHALAGLHPDGERVFGVLLDEDAAIHLEEGVTLSGFQRVDGFWEPTGSAAVEVVDGVVKPAEGASFPLGFIADAAFEVENQAAFAAAPGLELTQDRSQVRIPNTSLINPGFEDGLEGWSVTGNGRMNAVTEPVAAGGGAIRIFRRGKPWHALRQDVQGVLMFHREGEYRFGAKFKPEKPGGRFRIRLQIFENNENLEFVAGPVSGRPGPDGWVTIEETIDVQWEDWIERAELTFERVGDTGTYFIDDAVFEPLDPRED